MTKVSDPEATDDERGAERPKTRRLRPVVLFYFYFPITNYFFRPYSTTASTTTTLSDAKATVDKRQAERPKTRQTTRLGPAVLFFLVFIVFIDY